MRHVFRPRSAAAIAIAVTIALVPGVLQGSRTTAHADGGSVAVIVQADGTAEALAEAVVALGGEVTAQLPIVDGVAATLPAGAVDDLARVPGFRAVTPDRPMQVTGDVATAGDSAANGDVAAASDRDSAFRRAVRAEKAAQEGLTGDGVTVALVDTGITEVDDLAGRIVRVRDGLLAPTRPCKNLSGERGCDDSYGHGTFLAGLIAGSGAASDGDHHGVAPGARLLSVKVAGSDGSTDVSTVLAAIQWVVSFRDRYGIDVLNLSLGTDSTQTSQTDPLNYAVQRAWDAGIVVVVSAGNLGPDESTVMKPGDDPWVVTVGAIDDRGTPGLGDNLLPDFSARGPTAADGVEKPDVVAPGARVVSLEAPGSTIATEHPSSVEGPYRRGSGTSMATAIVSGTVALALEADPSTTPDEVKHALLETARPTASDDPLAVGTGIVDAFATALDAPPGEANEGLVRGTGKGSLAASRGTLSVQADDLLETVVEGPLTVQLLLWDPLGFVTGRWTTTTWYLTPWHLARVYATTWHGHNWHGHNWHGASWYGDPEPVSYGDPAAGGAWFGAWD